MTDRDDGQPVDPGPRDQEPSDLQPPGPLEPDDGSPTPSQPSGGVMIGPILGVVIGYVVFQLLPEDTPILLGLAIALVVIAVTTYASIEIVRRRAKRG